MRRVVLLLVGLLALASIAAASSGSATQAQPHWVITDLGTLGGNESNAVAINDKGQVIGQSEVGRDGADGNPIEHAFLWENGRMRDLGTLPGKKYSVAAAINAQGQIAGYSFASYNDDDEAMGKRAFVWEKGRMRDLGTLGFHSSAAVAINDRGQVLVQTYRAPGFVAVRAFLWRSGKVTDLGRSYVSEYHKRLMNNRGQVVFERTGHACRWQSGKTTCVGLDSSPDAINARGQFVGSSFKKDGSEHAFIWQDGEMTGLGHLGYGTSSSAAINDFGQVVGDSIVEVGVMHPFLWQKGKMVDLARGKPESLYGLSRATAINNRGQVVGYDVHAFIWQRGTITDLGTLGGVHWEISSEAVAINERGQIAGTSERKHLGNRHAVLWTLKR